MRYKQVYATYIEEYRIMWATLKTGQKKEKKKSFHI